MPSSFEKLCLSIVSGKRRLSIISIYIVAFFVVWTLATFWSRPRIVNQGILLPPPHHPNNNTTTNPPPQTPAPIPNPLELPAEYYDEDEQPQQCTNRLGLGYLKDLRQSRATYCTPDSKSQLTCFHSPTVDRIDSFCIAEGTKIDQDGKKFQTSCNLTDPVGIETKKPAPKLATFPSYWYETGPLLILDKYIDLTVENFEPVHDEPPKFTALVKREGSENPWHSLMEIMSLSMTFDVLQMSPGSSRRKGVGSFITPEDAANTQVVILDDKPDGPWFDLWRLFAQKPTVHLSELPAGKDIGNIIIPLPGASNPVWQGDWKANSCSHSEILRTFARRVLKHLKITRQTKEGDKIVVTFIDRKGTRKLIDIEKQITALKSRYSYADIRLVDFATLPLKEQIQIVRDSDVLAGVHGAGLTHVMWMKEHSVLVEILPKDFMHKGFRNVAGAMGIGYFSAHGGVPAGDEKGDIQKVDGSIDPMKKRAVDWQNGDVVLEEERLGKLMDAAIKSIYNTGSHNYDVDK